MKPDIFNGAIVSLRTGQWLNFLAQPVPNPAKDHIGVSCKRTSLGGFPFAPVSHHFRCLPSFQMFAIGQPPRYRTGSMAAGTLLWTPGGTSSTSPICTSMINKADERSSIRQYCRSYRIAALKSCGVPAESRFTRSISNILSGEPVGLSARLTAGSER